MKWVTRAYVYLDRVASPWLIKRFVDPVAEFAFVPWGVEPVIPDGAIPFALPGAELAEHDAGGTTFQKILAKYDLTDPTLQHLGRIVAHGVDYTLRRYRPQTADADGQLAVALVTISEGMLLVEHDDQRVLAQTFPVYDALYSSLRVHALMEARGEGIPDSHGKGPGVRTEYMRALLKEASRGADAGRR